MTDPICTCGHGATWHGEFRCFECEHCHLGETDVLRAALEKALEDTRRLDWLEAWLKSPNDKSRSVEAWRSSTDDVWLFELAYIPDSYGPMTISEALTLRTAIDAAMHLTTEGM